MRMHNPPHPGTILKEALEGLPMSVTEFAAYLAISRVTLSRIVNGRAGITPEVSIKLSDAFGQEQPDLWFKLQGNYDFWQVFQHKSKRVQPLKRDTINRAA